jgi:hypothetical protein
MAIAPFDIETGVSKSRMCQMAHSGPRGDVGRRYGDQKLFTAPHSMFSMCAQRTRECEAHAVIASMTEVQKLRSVHALVSAAGLVTYQHNHRWRGEY